MARAMEDGWKGFFVWSRVVAVDVALQMWKSCSHSALAHPTAKSGQIARGKKRYRYDLAFILANARWNTDIHRCHLQHRPSLVPLDDTQGVLKRHKPKAIQHRRHDAIPIVRPGSEERRKKKNVGVSPDTHGLHCLDARSPRNAQATIPHGC